MVRLVGEPSASRALGTRLGGPEADEIWSSLDATWMATRVAAMIAKAPPRQRHSMRELERVLDPRLGYALPRELARELYKHRDSLSACWAWDVWIGREAYSQLHVTATALQSIAGQLIREGRLPRRGLPRRPATGLTSRRGAAVHL